MTRERDIERLLDTWFREGPTEAPDRIIDAVADQIGHRSQRPAWRLDWRHIHMTSTFKLATAVVALALVAVVGYTLLPKSSSADGSAGHGSTSIEGTWVTTFTKADLAASPLLADQAEINDGNWGKWTLTFRNGRVSYVQSNSVDGSLSSGTFTTDGDALVMAFKTGANAGETFGFRWSTSGDVLTFRRDAALGPGPTPFLVRSWSRAS
ncbi:MAG: hypothetical protein QOD78_666 [Chloroflexota bacterium]|jgi:hypothetical protein|nr:hypothetical protein [Chloroflexota bacterium]MEA2612105.1 hypothetical protein [Chloroflexota bacterium]